MTSAASRAGRSLLALHGYRLLIELLPEPDLKLLRVAGPLFSAGGAPHQPAAPPARGPPAASASSAARARSVQRAR
jgi:hypothetical protein